MPQTREDLKGRPATLERWPGERHDHHRALLLFAMQGPGLRSVRSTARAMGMADGTGRNWRRQSCWSTRVEGQGKDCDQVALDLYRALYLPDYGELELPHVAKNVVRPLGGMLRLGEGAKAAHTAAQAVANATPRAMLEAEQAVGQAIATHKRDVRVDAERHVRLVDFSLALIAKKVKAKEVKVSVRDIPVLLECRARLVQVINGNQPGSGMGKLVESARVKHAKETGGDVMEAMFDDAEELVIILGALRTAQLANLTELAAADQATRDAQATA